MTGTGQRFHCLMLSSVGKAMYSNSNPRELLARNAVLRLCLSENSRGQLTVVDWRVHWPHYRQISPGPMKRPWDKVCESSPFSPLWNCDSLWRNGREKRWRTGWYRSFCHGISCRGCCVMQVPGCVLDWKTGAFGSEQSQLFRYNRYIFYDVTEFRSFRTRPDGPWGPPSLLYNGYLAFPWGKVAGAWRWSHTPI